LGKYTPKSTNSLKNRAKQHTDIIGEDFHWRFFGRKSIAKLIWYPFKRSFVEKDSIARIEKQLRTNPMISDIVYDKQLVNSVNDNIKKWYVDFNNHGFLAFIAVLLINSSFATVFSIDLS
jgi:cell division transport system permease protein